MHIQDRVKELRRVPASELKPNPRNWRTHPIAQQDALRGVLADVGFADAVVARELADGSLELVDGHLRAETMQDALVPVLVVDLDDNEATKVLLTHDALASMAGVDQQNFTSLLGEAVFECQAVESMLAGLKPDGAPPPPEDNRPEVDVPEAYQVLVECDGEAEQEALFNRLRSEGFRCRVITL
ncbi:ParB N-terminal domain-containing protein [Aeoliella sp.]|uniref:ParB N-terminal domain-containing protein n=1 Tax=Aeoliella sp. TaxID=2795800 RepID=UPI003CCB7FBE